MEQASKITSVAPVKGEEAIKRMVGKAMNPNSQVAGQADDTDDLDKQVRNARKRRELVQEQRLTQDLLHNDQQQAPFQVKGEVNLGRFDLMEERTRMKEERDAERQSYSQEIDKVKADRDATRDQLNAERFEALRRDFNSKLETLQANGARASNKSFKEQLEELKELAAELGLGPKGNGNAGDGGAAMLQLELAKINIQAAREEREFKWRMRQDEKNFTLEQQKMANDKYFKEQEIELQRDKQKTMASWPKTLGQAIAQGLMVGGNGDEAASTVQDKQPVKGRIHAAIGEAGDVECVNCHTPVGFGPSTEKTRCTRCNTIMDVVREPAVPAGGEES